MKLYTKLDANDQPLPDDAPDEAVHWIHDHEQKVLWSGPALSGEDVPHAEGARRAQAMHKDCDQGDVKKVLGIVDYGRCNPACDPVFFPHLKGKWVWTKTPCADDDACAWVVSFLYGSSLIFHRYDDGYVLGCRPASQ